MKNNWKKYALEFFSIFFAVILAFILNNWNDDRRSQEASSKILREIVNGLEKDLEDIRINTYGHEGGIDACKYWRSIVNGETVSLDSVAYYYLGLTRDFYSAQNVSGYETLKSRGLELIQDDTLRFAIISLYEYDFRALEILEEEYFEMQFQRNYYHAFNDIVAPYLMFNEVGNITGLQLPLQTTSAERNMLLSYLWKIQANRIFILGYYSEMENKINNLIARIERLDLE